jgi:hypothetical protein
MQLQERQMEWYWRECQLGKLTQLPTEEPQNPEAGAAWYDPHEHCVCIWDGMEWMAIPLD